MNDLTPIPYARPVHVAVARRVACPSRRRRHGGAALGHATYPMGVTAATNGTGALVRRRTEGFAVASAICGFTAIIPVVSQVIGLTLGMISLARIRRARRAGVELAGAKWAAAGIITSGFALFGWLAIFVAMSLIGSSLSHSAGSLNTLLQQTP